MRKKDKSSYVLSLPPAPVILCEFSNWLPISPSPPKKKNKCLHNILYFLRLKDKSDMACSATSETQNKSLNKCLTRQHLLKPKTTHDRVRACFGGNILIMMMGFLQLTHTDRDCSVWNKEDKLHILDVLIWCRGGMMLFLHTTGAGWSWLKRLRSLFCLFQTRHSQLCVGSVRVMFAPCCFALLIMPGEDFWRIECRKWWQSCQTSFISSIHAKGSWLKKCISLLCTPSVSGLSSTAHLEGTWLQLLKPSASENEDCFSGRDIATPTGHSLKSNEEHVEKDNLEKH